MNSSSAGNDTIKNSANTTIDVVNDLFKDRHLTDYLLIVLFCMVILTTVVSDMDSI